MRNKLVGVLVFAVLGGCFAACGTKSASSAAATADNGAPPPAGNFDSESAAAGGAGPTKANGPTGKASNDSTSSSGGGASGPLSDFDGGIPGCTVPDSGTGPSSIFMTVPNANWFASATQARGMLTKHLAPDPAKLRDSDFLAYYAPSYGTIAPNGNGIDVVALTGPGQSVYHVAVQIGVRAPALPAQARPPTSLTFVLDTSISMAGRSMDLAIAAMQAATKSLAAGDAVNVVTTLASAAPLKVKVAAKDDPKLLAALGSVQSDGGDDIPGAIARAYDVALGTYKHGGLNRVIFISDGGALPTLLDVGLISGHAAPGAEGDIRLVGVGVGDAEGYQPALLERAAGAGLGAALFVDSKLEAGATLGPARFDAVMGVAAAQVKLQLSFPWYFVPDDQTQGGVFSSDASQIVPTEVGPGGVLTFRQILRVCSPYIIDPNDTIGAVVSWQSPAGGSPTSSTVTPTLGETASNPEAVFKGKAVLAYVEALRSLQPSRLKAAHDLIAGPNTPVPTDPDLVEIASLLTKHPLYTP